MAETRIPTHGGTPFGGWRPSGIAAGRETAYCDPMPSRKVLVAAAEPAPHGGNRHPHRPPPGCRSRSPCSSGTNYVGVLRKRRLGDHRGAACAPSALTRRSSKTRWSCFKNVAVIARPGADERQAGDGRRGEGHRVARLLDEPHPPSPARSTGGDCLEGRRHRVRRARADAPTATASANCARSSRPVGATVIAVPLTKVLHLKSAVTALPDGTIIGYPPAVDDTSFFPRFVAMPEESGAPRRAPRWQPAVDRRRLPRVGPRCSRGLGYETVPVDIGEFEKLGRLRHLPVGFDSASCTHDGKRVAIASISETVLVDISDGIATVTLNRPEIAPTRSILSWAAAFPQVIAACDARDDVLAIILTGADPRVLRRGSTCASCPPASEDQNPGRRRAFRAALPPHTTPVIGGRQRCRGHRGLRVGARLRLPHRLREGPLRPIHMRRVGVLPGWGLTVMLPEAIGIRRAKQLSLSGAFLDAANRSAVGVGERGGGGARAACCRGHVRSQR